MLAVARRCLSVANVATLLIGLIAFTKAGRTAGLRMHAASAFLLAMPAGTFVYVVARLER